MGNSCGTPENDDETHIDELGAFKTQSSMVGYSEEEELQFATMTPKKAPNVVEEEIKSLEIWIFCEPDFGHMIPCFFIGSELANQRGHSVKFVSCKYQADGKTLVLPKIEGKLREGGMEFLPIEASAIDHVDDPDSKELRPSFVKRWELHTPILDKLLKDAVRKPDVMLVDFTSFSGANVAIDNNIPFVINFPGPVAMVHNIESADSWLVQQMISMTAGQNMLKVVKAILVRMRSTVTLVHSFWGLDDPCPLYPNIIVCGPCFPRHIAGSVSLETSFSGEGQEDLLTFLQKAKEVQAAIVYITMGSLANLNKCEVKALYEGAGAATADGKPCYVIWSLRGKSRKLLHEVIQEQKPPVPSTEEQTEIGRFFIKGWLPQIDILNYEDVKAVITHCGWGGTMEVIAAEKPILTHPFFGDQPMNAKLLADAGMAIELTVSPTTTTCGYTADNVATGLTRLMDPQEGFAAKAKSMNKLLDASPGAKLARNVIEHLAAHPIGITAITKRPGQPQGNATQ